VVALVMVLLGVLLVQSPKPLANALRFFTRPRCRPPYKPHSQPWS